MQLFTPHSHNIGQITDVTMVNNNSAAIMLLLYQIVLRANSVLIQLLKEAASDTFSIKIAQSAFAFQLKQLFERLNLLASQIDPLDAEIITYYEKFDCYLHTISDIGVVAAAFILVEIGDITRFHNSTALVAYAGIDPSVFFMTVH